MFGFFKKNTDGKKKIYVNDQENYKNLTENFYEFFESLHNKPDEEVILEIKVINSNGKSQEVEIKYGKKSKRVRISKPIPAELTFDLDAPPSISVQALKLDSLANPQKDFFLYKKRLLEAITKIQQIFISQKFAITENEKYIKLWNSTSSQNDVNSDDINNRPNLTTIQKALLLAIINKNLPENHKVNREIISQKYEDITDKISFKKFIFEAINLTKNYDALINLIFLQNKFTSDMMQTLRGQIKDIINDESPTSRDSKIKSLRSYADDSNNEQRMRWQ